MSLRRIRLRGGGPRLSEAYPLGQIPNEVLQEIGRLIVHRLAVGMSDITGDDFGTIFAAAIGGEHRTRPIGVADVVLDGCAWSCKTIHRAKPFTRPMVARLITGRCSPDFSAGISDARKDLSRTVEAILSIWNSRVEKAREDYDDLRMVVMIRNSQTREFSLFEEEVQRYTAQDYAWRWNKPGDKGNLEGRDRVTDRHRFTWQPSGAQLSMLKDVPGSARNFSIGPNIPIVRPKTILRHIEYFPGWIDIEG